MHSSFFYGASPETRQKEAAKKAFLSPFAAFAAQKIRHIFIKRNWLTSVKWIEIMQKGGPLWNVSASRIS